MNSTARRRITAVGTATVACLALGAGPALAHVTVDPGEAPAGSHGVVDFKVPNEKDDASTTKVEVTFPQEHPLTSVMPEPVPGWKAKVSTSKLDEPVTSHGKEITEAVTRITWTGGEIAPGEFQRFPVSLGELPHDSGELVFKALQTYDDDEVVRWIEEPRKGEPEPENPAPVLQLTSAESTGHGVGTGDGTHTQQSASGTDAAGGTDTTARVLGVAGIVVGAAGVAFGVLAGRRRSA